jgi:hypothetical protein
MLMAEKNKATFDLTTFLARAGLGRRIVDVKPSRTFFCPGRSGRLSLLPSERPSNSYGRFAPRQRGYHRDSFYRRFRWRGVSRGSGWAAFVHGHCH